MSVWRRWRARTADLRSMRRYRQARARFEQAFDTDPRRGYR